MSQPLSTDSITVEANIELDGLEPNTEYYFYVQSDCGNSDYGNWSEEGRFHTSCSLSTLPFEEDFELVNIGSLPSCWVANMEMGGEWGTGLPSPTYQPVCKSDVAIGSKSFCLSAFYEFNTALNAPKVTKSWLTLPEIMSASVIDIQMSFTINTSKPNRRLSLGLSNNQLDI